MKYFSLLLLVLVMVGGGCRVEEPAVAPASSQELDEALLPVEPAPLARMPALKDYLSWQVDPKFTVLDQGDGNVRIQNFVSQDDPKAKYPADAFYIDLTIHDVVGSQVADQQKWRQTVDNVVEIPVGGRKVLLGRRLPGGDSWFGTSYFVAGAVTIGMGAQTEAGAKLAEGIIHSIVWMKESTSKTPRIIFKTPYPEPGYSLSHIPQMHAVGGQEPYALLPNAATFMVVPEYFSYHPLNYRQDAWLAVGATTMGKEACFAPLSDGGKEFSDEEIIGGAKFRVATMDGAAAGNRYENTVYRTFRAGACFEMVTTLHYASDWTEVDEKAMKKVQDQGRALLKEAVATFRFGSTQ